MHDAEAFPAGSTTTRRSTSSRGNVDLTPATAYNCVKTDAGGNVVASAHVGSGRERRRSRESSRSQGVIFIDGNLTWSNLSNIEYDGRGTIYASGTLTIQNQADLCGVVGL